MKRFPRKNKDEGGVRRLWTFEEARQAAPYLRSIICSLREHWQEWLWQSQQAKKLSQKPGRPNRHERIAHQDATLAASRAQTEFHQALEELHTLDVKLQNPHGGIALIPFGYEEELAWFIFDLFAPQNLDSWRFDRDNLATRRPLTKAIVQPDVHMML